MVNTTRITVIEEFAAVKTANSKQPQLATENRRKPSLLYETNNNVIIIDRLMIKFTTENISQYKCERSLLFQIIIPSARYV